MLETSLSLLVSRRQEGISICATVLQWESGYRLPHTPSLICQHIIKKFKPLYYRQIAGRCCHGEYSM